MVSEFSTMKAKQAVERGYFLLVFRIFHIF